MAERHSLPRPLLRGLLEGVEITSLHGDLDVPVQAVHHDSRKIEPGDVFFALDGGHVRGLDFADQARRRGAVAVVAEEIAPGQGTTVAVKDVRRAMALASCVAAGHPTSQVPTVGITGTNGKTTTAYLLEAALAAVGHSAGVIGTIDAHLGDQALDIVGLTTPEAPELQHLAAEMVRAGAGALFLEVTSHGIKLRRVHGCRFKVVAFTNLTQDHLDLHGSMEAYAATKLELFNKELAFSPEAVAVVNIDDPLGERVVAEASCPVMKVSAQGNPAADIRVIRHGDGKSLSLQGVEVEVEVGGHGVVKIESPLIGEHNVANLCLALGIVHALDLPLEGAAKGFAQLKRVPGRVESVVDPRGSVVLVDYAHTPDALARVTEAIAEQTKGRLFVVFGCGGDRDQSKRPLMGEAASRKGDIVMVTSDNPRTEDPLSIIEMTLEGVLTSGLPRLELENLGTTQRGFTVEPDRRKAITAAVTAAAPGDVVLIAGKGHEPYQILGTKKIHFDDREVAAAAIQAALGKGEEEAGVKDRT